MTSLGKLSAHRPHFHRHDDPATAAATQVLGDDDQDDIPIVERARAEDAKLRKLFSLMEDEGVVNEFVCGASANHSLYMQPRCLLALASPRGHVLSYS